uniref:Purple acid phosphatase n=1 Tax=Mucochytrium quahogii TaxID=96639 RepID=A0A7S2RA30_9STRA|mmetsp:Transcript_11903/g.25574  ORF Transcript_11903/g.25574 Transcript_11903/m.25574 type:complete len:588 (+) Transcript_11903:65-1828(+)
MLLDVKAFFATLICICAAKENGPIAKGYRQEYGRQLDSTIKLNGIRQVDQAHNQVPLLQYNISYSGIMFSSPNDYVAIYPCRDEDCGVLDVAPLRFKQVNSSASEPVLLYLWVMPGVKAVRIAYVAPLQNQYPEVLCMTEVLTIDKRIQTMPMGVRTSLVADEPNAVRIIWSQSRFSVKSLRQIKKRFRVHVGTESGNYSHGVHGVKAVYSYNSGDFCDKQMQFAATTGYVDPGYQVEVIIRGLKHDTEYYYKITDTHGKFPERELEFVTPPTLHQRTRMSIFGDQGQSLHHLDNSSQHSWDFHGQGELPAENTTKLMKHLADNVGIRLFAHIGDLSYATGSLGLWDAWLRQNEVISSKYPYMTAIGNHEMVHAHSFVKGADSQGECGRPYAAFFPFASQDYHKKSVNHIITSRGYENPWYSYDYGLVHVTVMSTEHDYTPGSRQYKWIKRDLESVNRGNTPWLVFQTHRPLYISGQDTLQPRVLETLLLQNKVDIVVSGHHHTYQRSCRHLANSKCQESNGIQYFVAGTAGYASAQLPSDRDSRFEFATDKAWGIPTFDFVNATAANVQFFDNSEFSVLDQTWVYR